MRLHIVIPKTSELDDWEEKVKQALSGKVEPLEIDVKWVPRCFDVIEALDDSADVNVVVLAPKKEYIPAIAPLISALLEKKVKIFFGTYDEMPSLLEDFVSYLLGILGVEEKEIKTEEALSTQ